MAANLLTIKEIAKHLDVPESNVRYYRDKFLKYIPYVGKGRKRRYKPEALKIFEYIVNGMRKGKTSADIEHEIAGVFPVSVQDRAETETTQAQSKTTAMPGTETDLLSAQTRALERIAEAMTKSSSLDTVVHNLSAEVTNLKKAMVLMWNKQKERDAHVEEIRENLDDRLQELEDLVKKLK